jgi:hypothetical protein
LLDDCAGVLWRIEDHEPLTERPWAAEYAEARVAAIAADAEAAVSDGVWPLHPLDDEADGDAFTTLYLGGAGVLWALHDLGSRLGLAELATRAIERYRVSPDFGKAQHRSSWWMGETGLLVLAARVKSPAADLDRLRGLIHANRHHPTWELMWGSPGSMLAARASGLDSEWVESASLLLARWEAETDLWTQDLYGRTARLLGPAHGFAGNVHALRGYIPDELLRQRVTRALESTAMREGRLVNWPPVAGAPAGRDRIRVQWCHGAPGIIATVGDLMPIDLALAGGELVWEAGPLRKGPGLCHGTAGNGYALLKLFSLTSDELWLERARRFAMHAIEQVQRQHEQFGRGRYTLWTGDIGVAHYLRACVQATSSIPTIDMV